MKTLNYLSAIVLSTLSLSSCANLQQVADDDVYVTKNPILSSAEEVNDITSYENYRYHKTAKTYNSRYGRGAAIASGSRNGYYDLGYMYAFHPNYLMYGRPSCGQFGFNVYFYDPQYAFNHYGLVNTSFYSSGNPYYNYYGNNLSLVKNNNSSGTHYGPRSFLSGVNSSSRGGSTSVLGLAKNNNTPNKSSALHSNYSRDNFGTGNNGRNSPDITNSSIKNTRNISSGTTLSGTNRAVSSSSVNRNNNSVSSTRSTGSNSGVSSSGRSHIELGTGSGSSSRSTGSGSSVGTTRNSGSSGSSASPRGGGSSGSSTPTRRGGR